MKNRIVAQRLLACVGEPSRFRVVRSLHGGQQCVSELARSVGLSQSCTTRHLQALRREGVVRGERRGKRVVFRLCLDDPAVGALIRWATTAATGSRRERDAEQPRDPAPPGERRARARIRNPSVTGVSTTEGVGGEEEPRAGSAPGPEAAPGPPVHPSSSELEDYLL